MRIVTIGIGAAARTLNTTPRTLRYYEQLGLLNPDRARDAGHRRYSDAELHRARRLLALRDLGLTIADLRTLLDGEDSEPASAILRAQAGRIDDEITRLTALRHRIDTRLADGRETLALLEDIAVNFVLTQIYTRDGDDGTSAVSPDVRIPKTEQRFEVLGDVDELVTAIGMAVAAPGAQDVELLRGLQNDLFDVGADLTMDQAEGWHVDAGYVTRLENACDRAKTRVTPAESFVLPGQSLFTAALHHSRAICRRAERHSWALTDTNPHLHRYLNRLSDLLFLLARAHEPAPEPMWRPQAHEPR